jgi:glycosyltransferase involved in cell wall biosynthesis
MRHILFVYGALQMGGIETFLVRVSRRLSAAGVRVTVLLASRKGAPELSEELARWASIVYLEDLHVFKVKALRRLTLYQFFAPISRTRAEALLEDVDHIHFLESFSMLTACRLARLCGGRKVTGGVYYQYEFATWDMRGSYFVNAVAHTLRHVVPPRNMVFFNEACRNTYARHLGQDYSESALLPIGVDLSRLVRRDPARARKGRVVSIGRINSFKTYNFQFPHAVQALAAKGLQIEYHIYGDGDRRQALEAQIREMGCEQHIHLHGPIEYARLPEVLEDAWLFVGSGTAIIEAAGCGVPALIGVESEPQPQTYGFLHSMPGLDYQEADIGYAKRSFAEFCEQLHALSDDAYAQECERSARKAEEFSIERLIEGFLELDKRAGVVNASAPSARSLLLFASALVDRLAPRALGTGFWRRYEARR